MKRSTEIIETRGKFHEEISNSLELAMDIVNMMTANYKAGNYTRPPWPILEQIYEFSFLRIILSWEAFLERTLVLYMMGEQASIGHKPVAKVKNIEDENIAYALLSGKMPYDADRDFLPYLLAPKRLKKVANKLFHNHRYDLVGNSSDEGKQNHDMLEHARRIRNHIAHRSTKSEAEFELTMEYFLDKRYNFSAGKFLGMKLKEEMRFGDKSVGKDRIYLTAYCDFFGHLADIVAPLK